MIKNIGFFDVDSLESGCAAADVPAPIYDGLHFRERIYPISESLNQLYLMARNDKIPFVFSTCCSGKFLEQGERNDTLFVMADDINDNWIDKIPDAKMVYLEKIKTNNPAKNYEIQCYNIFRNNSNAFVYFKESSIDLWIVFGNGFELCVCNAIKNILKTGKKVWLIQDVIIQSAKGYGNSGTPDGKHEAMRELSELGVKLVSLDEFNEWYYETL